MNVHPVTTGKERDAETGLDFFGARYFSAAQGRFTSPDTPLVYAKPENPQTWNLYSYARNNPLKYVDPDGHDDVAAAGCGEDTACLKKLAEQRAKGAELISGAAKSVVNSVITLSNAVNTVVDNAIAPFTDFRFGVPGTDTLSSGDRHINPRTFGERNGGGWPLYP